MSNRDDPSSDLGRKLDYNNARAGAFTGAIIHDVAQVVGDGCRRLNKLDTRRLG